MFTAWDQNISKTYVFIFYHSIQLDGASDYTFYNAVDCPNEYIETHLLSQICILSNNPSASPFL